MEHLFSLDSEGGPLLCLDARAAVNWLGIEDCERGYDQLSSEIDRIDGFSAEILPIGGFLTAVWEMDGSGTADVFLRTDGTILIVRSWLEENTPQELMQVVRGIPTFRKRIGEIDVPSRILAVLWAPESGELTPQLLGTPFQSIPGTSISNSAFVIRVSAKKYVCYDERIEIGVLQARRLTMSPVQ